MLRVTSSHFSQRHHKQLSAAAFGVTKPCGSSPGSDTACAFMGRTLTLCISVYLWHREENVQLMWLFCGGREMTGRKNLTFWSHFKEWLGSRTDKVRWWLFLFYKWGNRHSQKFSFPGVAWLVNGEASFEPPSLLGRITHCSHLRSEDPSTPSAPRALLWLPSPGLTFTSFSLSPVHTSACTTLWKHLFLSKQFGDYCCLCLDALPSDIYLHGMHLEYACGHAYSCFVTLIQRYIYWFKGGREHKCERETLIRCLQYVP